MKLINGIELSSQRAVSGEYKYIHHSFDSYIIRSNFPIEDIFKKEILNITFPGQIGTYLYPYDAILSNKTGSIIKKNKINEILSATTQRYTESLNNVLFDIPVITNELTNGDIINEDYVDSSSSESDEEVEIEDDFEEETEEIWEDEDEEVEEFVP